MGHMTKFLPYRHFLRNNLRLREWRYQIEFLGNYIKVLRQVCIPLIVWNYNKIFFQKFKVKVSHKINNFIFQVQNSFSLFYKIKCHGFLGYVDRLICIDKPKRMSK